METAAPTSCPRCAQPLVDQEFYGVCSDCSGELRTSYDGAKRDVEAAEYEPKLNVTPNAVALKE